MRIYKYKKIYNIRIDFKIFQFHSDQKQPMGSTVLHSNTLGVFDLYLDTHQTLWKSDGQRSQVVTSSGRRENL